MSSQTYSEVSTLSESVLHEHWLWTLPSLSSPVWLTLQPPNILGSSSLHGTINILCLCQTCPCSVIFCLAESHLIQLLVPLWETPVHLMLSALSPHSTCFSVTANPCWVECLDCTWCWVTSDHTVSGMNLDPCALGIHHSWSIITGFMAWFKPWFKSRL